MPALSLDHWNIYCKDLDATVRFYERYVGLKNGDLLKRAESQFNVFITADKKLRYQQNLANTRLAIIVLPTNQVTVVAMLLATIGQTIGTIKAGSVLEIPLPPEF